MANWGERLQRILDKQGIKQKELAEKIEVTPSNVSQLIGNAYPPLQKIEKICEALDIKLWQFFMEDDGESMKDYVASKYKNITDTDLLILNRIKSLSYEKNKALLEFINKSIDLLG